MSKSKLEKLLDTFVQMRPRLEALARSRTGCGTTAEDLIQDAWVKLETASIQVMIDNPGGYITQVANRTVIDHIRKERRRGEINQELADLLSEGAGEVSAERTLIARENLKAVEAVLETLPEQTRKMFLMNRLEGVSHRALAERFGMTDKAVYYHIRRVLERLAEIRN
ncbi:RNA polymerase sigma factor [Terrihabitans sp. B22-R8]|uniref:RNA polymerase sigma factor n=1 Tax=Terrihabitans sp. B22-R8 TaxID=3425128 RepID=UPI00403CCDE1